MTALSTEEQAAFRDSFARLLAERSREADVRRTMLSDEGYDLALWSQLAELGVTGLIVPQMHGGVGAGPVELELLMEEAGAALLCSPLLSSAVLSAAVLAQCDDDAAKALLLPSIASGERIATVALADSRGLWTSDAISVHAEFASGAWSLTGAAEFVTYGAQADVLLVFAKIADGLALFEVPPCAPGVERANLRTFDQTQRMARIAFRGAPATRIDGADAKTFERVLDIARVALAGEQAGAARRVFEFTIDYLKTRVQFGRPIGGFQALKHMAADLLIEVESATTAAREAAAALAAGRADAEPLINLAAFACADAFSDVAAASIQMHGGIAFTWDHPAHLYLRRARADAQLLGSSDHHRDRYLHALETAHG